MYGEEIQVGWYVVEEDVVLRDASYPTASWYKEILVRAGKYPALAQVDKSTGYVVDFPGVYASLPGECVAAWFPSSFGGVPFGSPPAPNEHPDVGEPAVYRTSAYAHAVARRLYEGRETPWLLSNVVEPVEIEFESFDGRWITTYKLEVE